LVPVTLADKDTQQFRFGWKFQIVLPS
jgi:hypothetical protein